MIKDVIDKLQPEQKGQLMHAFENEFSQYIVLPGNKFIGVNVRSVRHLDITESAGVWFYGNVKGKL